ncbi:MAG: Flagellum-specific muramidase [Caldanaerobacter subterraneus]|jgi:flagellar protein FlgJ|uniref:Muramidase n=1 Tax=Caldanaerobacter subterraneus TaxID=911092 RepID=A0A101E519_9THEO|nr:MULTISPECIES: rod-binding protein [Caldanaerobacter]KUK08612.1 MAG: Flagellum-specific muramidase [Caldanaerobacter subterraneus]MDI3517887.1 peptidoglycan hydrolase FlgJ [Caldanaerobacter sp.]HBT48995.1 muramidase [Caldanaerobacter subterraneus]
MEINPIEGAIKNMLPLWGNQQAEDFERIINKAMEEKDKDKLMEACKQLEANFISLMLKEMRKTIPEDPLTGNNLANDIFTSMLYDKYAELMAQSGGFGLAEEIYNQLSKKV